MVEYGLMRVHQTNVTTASNDWQIYIAKGIHCHIDINSIYHIAGKFLGENFRKSLKISIFTGNIYV